jgi:hypothetical protein
MIPFLVALEIGLRLVTDASNAGLSWIRRRRHIESDLGIWKTLWALIHRPLAAPLVAKPGEPPGAGGGA